MSKLGVHSPSCDEIFAIGNAFSAWSSVKGLGPAYFVPDRLQRSLYRFLSTGKSIPLRDRRELASLRCRMINFYSLIDESQEIILRHPSDYGEEVEAFLEELGGQIEIWRGGSFKRLDFSPAEERIYLTAVAKTAPALFFMGFPYAITHSSQVSRLTATMGSNLGGRHSEVLQSAIVGWLHDPKFHPGLDLTRQNLATHPVNAAALAWCLMRDADMKAALDQYFHGNERHRRKFSSGIVDALAINNDSRFVQMMVILPALSEEVSRIYGPGLADELEGVIESRLASASQGICPPRLPAHLHGALAQIRLDSGLRGIRRSGWIAALAEAGIASRNPDWLFNALISGRKRDLRNINRLRSALHEGNAILKAEVRASTLFHHHQEVSEPGRVAAEALVIADPMMLDLAKVATAVMVSKPIGGRARSTILDCVASYVESFDDNNRLMPKQGRPFAMRWQRAVYLAVLDASDRLTGSALTATFKTEHVRTTVKEDIDDLRTILLAPESWADFAALVGSPEENPRVAEAIAAMETAYKATVDKFRILAQSGAADRTLDKFYP